LSTLSVGSHTITAAYSADIGPAPSISNALADASPQSRIHERRDAS
jgi:hypothetical protein